jgi:hypothetical protein
MPAVQKTRNDQSVASIIALATENRDGFSASGSESLFKMSHDPFASSLHQNGTWHVSFCDRSTIEGLHLCGSDELHGRLSILMRTGIGYRFDEEGRNPSYAVVSWGPTDRRS